MAIISNFFSTLRFDQLIAGLYQGGWYQFVFPFMLVYAIVFTILNNVSLFENKKPVKVIIALVFALFAIAFPITGNSAQCGVNVSIYPTYGCQTLGDLMMTLFPGVTAFSIGILALYIIAAMLGVDLMNFFGKNHKDNRIIQYVLGALGVFVVIYYYARGFGWFGFNSGSTWWLTSLFTDPMLYVIIVFGIFFFWVVKDDDSGKKPREVTRTEKFDEK